MEKGGNARLASFVCVNIASIEMGVRLSFSLLGVRVRICTGLNILALVQEFGIGFSTTTWGRSSNETPPIRIDCCSAAWASPRSSSPSSNRPSWDKGHLRPMPRSASSAMPSVPALISSPTQQQQQDLARLQDRGHAPPPTAPRAPDFGERGHVVPFGALGSLGLPRIGLYRLGSSSSAFVCCIPPDAAAASSMQGSRRPSNHKMCPRPARLPLMSLTLDILHPTQGGCCSGLLVGGPDSPPAARRNRLP